MKWCQNRQPTGHENYDETQEMPIKMAKMIKTTASVSKDMEVELSYWVVGSGVLRPLWQNLAVCYKVSQAPPWSSPSVLGIYLRKVKGEVHRETAHECSHLLYREKSKVGHSYHQQVPRYTSHGLSIPDDPLLNSQTDHTTNTRYHVGKFQNYAHRKKLPQNHLE